jgi:predicted DsbA family dithiol-disulfide isomerase
VVRLIAYSDYLCPWCFNAAVRLHRVEEEFAGAVTVEWRSFLLRPQPDPTRTLEQFRAYTKSWTRAAADPDGGAFQVWRTTRAALAQRSAAPRRQSRGPPRRRRSRACTRRCSSAYFTDNRDITDAATLRAIWNECARPAEGLAAADDPALLREVIDQHNEAVERRHRRPLPSASTATTPAWSARSR